MTMYMLVGGIGTLLGPLLGALAVPWLTQYLQFLQEYRFVVFGPILVLLVIFLPHGIVGTWLARRARRESRGRRAAPPTPRPGRQRPATVAAPLRGRQLKGRRACLKIDNLTKRFGGLAAVNDVTHHASRRGKINAIIGPNGAGKTTFFNLVSRRAPRRPRAAITLRRPAT